MLEKGLLNNETVHEIFKLLEQEKHTLGGLHVKLECDKLTVSKYVAQMEMSGIIQGRWETDEDGYWRRYYRTTNWEWARLIREILSSKANYNGGERMKCSKCGEQDISYFGGLCFACAMEKKSKEERGEQWMSRTEEFMAELNAIETLGDMYIFIGNFAEYDEFAEIVYRWKLVYDGSKQKVMGEKDE